MLTATTERAGEPGGSEVVRVAVDPELASDAVRSLRRGLGELAGGDVDGAVRALGEVRWAPGSVAIDVTSTSSAPSEASFGAAAGVGSLAFEGVDEEWTRGA